MTPEQRDNLAARYMTVDKLRNVLNELSAQGKGDYLIDVNSEYWIDLQQFDPIDDERKTINFSGTCE